MRSFTAIVHQDPGSALGLAFPDLPGCFAAAESWDDVPAAAAEALDLWFEDGADVTPAPFDAVRARPAVMAECSAGAVLVLIPYDPAQRAARCGGQPAPGDTGNGAGEGT